MGTPVVYSYKEWAKKQDSKSFRSLTTKQKQRRYSYYRAERIQQIQDRQKYLSEKPEVKTSLKAITNYWKVQS